MSHEGVSLHHGLDNEKKESWCREVCAFGSTYIHTKEDVMKRFVMLLSGVIFMVMAIGLTPAHAKIIGKNVDYTADGVTLKGYLAYDRDM